MKHVVLWIPALLKVFVGEDAVCVLLGAGCVGRDLVVLYVAQNGEGVEEFWGEGAVGTGWVLAAEV